MTLVNTSVVFGYIDPIDQMDIDSYNLSIDKISEFATNIKNFLESKGIQAMISAPTLKHVVDIATAIETMNQNIDEINRFMFELSSALNSDYLLAKEVESVTSISSVRGNFSCDITFPENAVDINLSNNVRVVITRDSTTVKTPTKEETVIHA